MRSVYSIVLTYDSAECVEHKRISYRRSCCNHGDILVTYIVDVVDGQNLTKVGTASAIRNNTPSQNRDVAASVNNSWALLASPRNSIPVGWHDVRIETTDVKL